MGAIQVLIWILAGVGVLGLFLASCSYADRVRARRDEEDEHAQEYDNWHVDGRSEQAEMSAACRYNKRRKSA